MGGVEKYKPKENIMTSDVSKFNNFDEIVNLVGRVYDEATSIKAKKFFESA